MNLQKQSTGLQQILTKGLDSASKQVLTYILNKPKTFRNYDNSDKQKLGTYLVAIAKFLGVKETLDDVQRKMLVRCLVNEMGDFTLEELDKAIQNSGLSNYIDSLEDKENTIVGERGIRISGGQKQRIGLARALYFSPEVLILDEATNSLDKETEKNILKQLLKIKDKITLIIVSHENEPLKIADKIYDLNEKLN